MSKGRFEGMEPEAVVKQLVTEAMEEGRETGSICTVVYIQLRDGYYIEALSNWHNEEEKRMAFRVFGGVAAEQEEEHGDIAWVAFVSEVWLHTLRPWWQRMWPVSSKRRTRDAFGVMLQTRLKEAYACRTVIKQRLADDELLEEGIRMKFGNPVFHNPGDGSEINSFKPFWEGRKQFHMTKSLGITGGPHGQG